MNVVRPALRTTPWGFKTADEVDTNTRKGQPPLAALAETWA